MKKRILATVLMLSVLAATAVGCGGNSSGTGGTSGTNTANSGAQAGRNSAESGTDASDGDDNVNLDGSLPIIKDPSKAEKMTMAIVVPAERVVPSGELMMTKKLAEETGVEFEWQEIPSEGSAEKINLMLSGGTLPDAFWNGISSTMAVQYSGQDIFMPTEDLVDQYMPRLKAIFEKRPEYKAASTAPDGHSYGFPYIEEMYGLVLTPGPFLINTAWLEKVGKSMPTTVDEWVDCLRAFRDAGDLNGNGVADEIPYALGLGSEDWFGSYNTFHQFTGAFGQADSYAQGYYQADHMRIIDDKVVFTATDDAYRKTANLFHMLNSEKLIDVDSFSPGPTADSPLYLNKIKGDQAVVGCMGLWAPVNQIPDVNVRKEYAAIPRMQGESGKTGFKINFSEMQDTSMVAITTECKNPEIIAAYVDYCFEPEISITLNWGAVGMIYVKGDDGVLHFDLDADNNIVLKEQYQTFGEMRSNSTPARGAMAVLNEYYGPVADYTWDALDLLEFQRQNGKEEILDEYTSVPKMMLSMDEQTKVSQIQPQISDVVKRYTMQWILDGNADATWDSYKAELEAAGLNDLLATFQQAYDRFLSSK